MILLNQLQLYAKQILNDYDKKKPSVLFKNNINITVAEAYKIQSLVTELRIKRGEKVIGYKIGSVKKQTQKNMVFHIQLGVGYGKMSCILMVHN